MDELVVHIDVWRTFGAGARVTRALTDLGQQAAVTAGRAEGARAALSSVNEVLAAMALLVCVYLARVFAIDLGGGALMAFAAVFFMSYRPFRDLGDARTALERGAQALDTLERLGRQAGGPPRAKGATEKQGRGPRPWGRGAPRRGAVASLSRR